MPKKQPSKKTTKAKPATAKGKKTSTTKKTTSKTKKATPKKAPSTKPVKHHGEDSFLVVGMGASAGGLEAFEKFFQNTPANSGMAFVLVQHMDPTRPSMLAELLKKYTELEVAQVKDGMKVQPNHVYIIPPNKDMGIINRTLQLFDPVASRGLRKPIDFFLRSLAADQKENAVGIILSGTGTEGTLSLKEIKGEGGLTLVQTPETAAYDSMPRSAVAANVADYILAPEKMPRQLQRYNKTRFQKPLRKTIEATPPENLLDKIFMLLRQQTGNDFSQYKRSTITRRIEKRMAVNQIEQMQEYVRYLQKSQGEVDNLFKELLIGVSNFFRDKEAFEMLKSKALAEILKSKAPAGQIRVWVPGCASGEEAYSIAMLMMELMGEKKKKLPVTIFATDIDEQAIEVARTGLYPDTIAADVSPARLKRFFIQENHFYRVKKELREMVVFAVHNLTKDPPFSKLDLVSCRNLLIYMNQDLQKKIFPIFQYSLNPDGILFLGSSESIGEFADLFGVVNKKWKIYHRKSLAPVRETTLDFGLTVSEREKRKLEKIPPEVRTTSFAEITEKLLLQHYAPASVVISQADNALYFYGDTGRYLQPTKGEASLNIIEMARPGLQIDLRSTLAKARKSGKEETAQGVKVKTNGELQVINLIVRPVLRPEGNHRLMLVVFEDVAKEKIGATAGKQKKAKDQSREQELEHELASTKEYLQTTIEELETSNEELKSSNEELQSTNEELQSTNEELETSKEELQSVNEEMVTVNTELQNKIEELAHANNDMNNLLASTGIGTIFLDNDLHIKRFTPSITKVISLINTDIGRPVKHLASNLEYDQLQRDAEAVLKDLKPRQREVQSKDGVWYSMTIMPYRTTENVIDGVVMTFVDITDQKFSEDKLRRSNEHLNLIMQALPAVPYSSRMKKDDFELTFIGESVNEVMGFLPENFLKDTKFWFSRMHREDRKKVRGYLAKALETGIHEHEYRWKCADGKYYKFKNTVRLVKMDEKENYIVGIWQKVV